MSSVDCIYSHIIPANPDISGYGVRVAIYIQNLLSFIPAFYALMDGKISVKELQVVEKQSTTILITAFAVLISAMVQAGTYGLYSFHTSIILSLSWMNNTNTFIYFLLYIHHKIDLDLDPSKRVEARWSAWFYHVVEPFGIHRRNTKDTGNDAEASSPAPGSTSSSQDGEKNPSGEYPSDSLSKENEVRTSWVRSCWSLLRRKFVLVLGSLHLTTMAALGIWMWSSPYRYEATQAHRLHLPQDLIPLHCTNTTLFGSSIPLTSTALNRASLIFYSVFLAPCLNLIVPAGFFLVLFMRYGESSSVSESIGCTGGQDEDKDINLPSSITSSIVNTRTAFARMMKKVAQIIRAAWPILAGLSILLFINIVFIVDIETTINRAVPYQDANDESNWTFGQTLALLLLVLPMRDVFDYIKESWEVERAARCTVDLKDAVEHQDLDSLRRAAKYADNVHVHINESFPSALQFAAYKGDISAVRILMDRDANVNIEGGDHGPPLVAAASAKHEDIFRALIKRQGAAIGLTDKKGMTALHRAALHGLKDTVKLLLEHDANVGARSNAGLTPLHCAAMGDDDSMDQNHEAVITLLLHPNNHLDINQVNDSNGWEPLVYAVHYGRQRIVEFLLEKNAYYFISDNDEKTPLVHAVQQGHEAIVKVLLDLDSWWIDRGDRDKMTPLLHATSSGHEPIVRLLLEHSADVNQAQNDGKTPLISAAVNGHEPIVRLLLDHSADVNQAENDGTTPLIWAAYKGHEPIVRLFLDHSADVNQAENDGWTPLIYAARYGHEPMVRLLLDHSADVNQAENDGKTPLIWAAVNGHEPIVRLLLDHSADVNQAENDGWTPLIWAAYWGRTVLMDILLDFGADLEHASDNGQTALLHAVQENKEAAVQLLLKRGADFTKVDNDGRNALSIAREKDNDAIVTLLKDAKAQRGSQRGADEVSEPTFSDALGDGERPRTGRSTGGA